MAKGVDKETKLREKEAKELMAAFESELTHGHYQAALNFLRDNLEAIYSFFPEYAIDHDLALRIGLGDFDGAYADLDEFQNRPYVRQSVEEILRDGKKKIRDAEREYDESLSGKPKSKPLFAYSPDDSEEKVSLMLQEKPKKDKAHVEFYLALLSDASRSNYLRTGALIRLIELGFENKVTFTKNGRTFNVVPKTAKAPGDNPAFQSIANAMGKKRFSEFSGVPINLLYSAEICLYPAELSQIDEADTLIEAFYCLCLSSFSKPFEFPSERVKEAFCRLYELIFGMPYSPKGNVGQA